MNRTIEKFFFSIIIPTYNSGETLPACLESILNQTFQNFEIIIVDGLSSDDTVSIVKRFKEKSPNVRWVSEKDKGIYDAMNKGIKMAKGEWLYFLGSDDLLNNNKVLEEVFSLDKTGYEVVYGNVNIIGNSSWAKDGDLYDGKFNLQKLLNKNICHQAIFYNEVCFSGNSFFNHKYKLCADWDFNFKCWARKEFLFMNLTIANFCGGGNTTIKNKDTLFLSEINKNLRVYFGRSLLRNEKVKEIRPIAIYLPQFHPIPENDEWWGKGFTEWTNVVKARPLYKGHYQPQLPADLGFYDLRISEVREEQARLAKENGIYGFCYYHYWFNGRQILERPFQEVFESGKPDFPFMLCWANENWTRSWDGLENEVLIKQQYCEEDDRMHIKSLIPFFKDQRYIRVEDRPVFSIYRSDQLPNAKRTIEIWREEAEKENIDLYMCRFEGFGMYGKSFLKSGFDASIEFQPFYENLDRLKERLFSIKLKNDFKIRALKKFYEATNQQRKLNILLYKLKERIRKEIQYDDLVDFIFKNYNFCEDYVRYPSLTPGWDNTARRGEKGFILHHSSPSKFQEWLSFLKGNYKANGDENFIFINAWNEWGEGNHLEPCQKWGMQYLEAIKNTFGKNV